MQDIELTFEGNLIEIDKWFFYLTKDGNITYNSQESKDGGRFECGFATERNVESAYRSEGKKVFNYRNPDSKDGLWHQPRVG